jgi:hypothetical protein
VLRRREPREALLAAVAGSDRLVLLGDAIELRHGPLRDAFAVAQPVLEAVGAALPAGAEVVIVPGNHDHRLLRPWLTRRSSDGVPSALGLEASVDWREGEPLARIAGWLAPARTRAAYPGVWLRDDVYAMHGHYGDRNTTVPILERLGSGVLGRVFGERNGRPTRAEDYEATLEPMYALIDALAEQGGRGAGGGGALQLRAWRDLSSPRHTGLRSRATAACFATLVFALNRGGIGPLQPDVSGQELRRAGLRAFELVLTDLGVPAGYVLSGHTHRAGPLPTDDRGEWLTSTGASLLNTGSWVYEAAFVSDGGRSSPYRPGFAVRLSDAEPPELVNLLDPA